MNCREFMRRWTARQVVDGEMKVHLTECAACGELLAWNTTELTGGPQPDLERIGAIQREMMRNWQPVNSIGSNAALVGWLCLAFLILALSTAAITGLFAVRVLAPWQMAVYYGALVAVSLTAAVTAVQFMVPGSKVRLDSRYTLPLAGALLISVVIVLFPSFDTKYVHGGSRCFWIGVTAATGAALSFAALLRRMLPTAPVTAAASTGFLAGLCGVAALALHCPVMVSMHILLWHFTVLLVATLAGASVGYIGERITAKNLIAYRNS